LHLFNYTYRIGKSVSGGDEMPDELTDEEKAEVDVVDE
jgi:hypothetical protein